MKDSEKRNEISTSISTGSTTYHLPLPNWHSVLLFITHINIRTTGKEHQTQYLSIYKTHAFFLIKLSQKQCILSAKKPNFLVETWYEKIYSFVFTVYKNYVHFTLFVAQIVTESIFTSFFVIVRWKVSDLPCFLCVTEDSSQVSVLCMSSCLATIKQPAPVIYIVMDTENCFNNL